MRAKESIQQFLESCEILLSHKQNAQVSERQLAKTFGLSKSAVHRMLVVATLPHEILRMAYKSDLERYVLFDYAELSEGTDKLRMRRLILEGQVKTRKDFTECLTKKIQPKIKPKLPTIPSFLQ